jgi:putative glutamine amidotransferase
MKTGRPLVAVLGHGGVEDGLEIDALGEHDTSALVAIARVAPLLVPRGLPVAEVIERIDLFDGVLLTGDGSNIEPWRYGTTVSASVGSYDPRRDALALALVAEARRRALPLLGICRGFEEINVAYGGTLWTAVHEVGFADHRESADPDPRVRYQPAHEVRLVAGGRLHATLGVETWTVNSLHGQGVRNLGAGLTIEARATDGLIEAARDTEAGRWIFGVQWHPEWESTRDRLSHAIFESFGEACSRFRERPRLAFEER